MNRQVNAIAGRLSLRPPQRKALEILDRITEIAPPRKGADVAAALAAIRSEFPSVTDFEREFPSVCFALATGVGKTRLMGALIGYLHLAHGIKNFFALAPNLTIYDKLITDFTPNTAKYVFKGIAEFATEPPQIITGDNYDQPESASDLFGGIRVNIFNISKINTEVRGGSSPRIKRLSEYIGESYFDYLAALPDLVLLMDESHRYRASAGVKAINELKPILGLELTATPYVETRGRPVRFSNIIYEYPLAQAMADGFVKEPAVVTRKDFSSAGMAAEQIERLKLEDGIRLHESVKVELETYARETGNPIVKPFLLVIAQDTTHAAELLGLIQSDGFFGGRYRDRVIQVDSSRTGAAEEEMIARLLKVEHADEPTEIVIHVNMLKEGWDVTNLYTIVPLRAANARVLIEQSIGRGLRLPYGRRTGVAAVDRLNIVAHDKFQEIIDEANKADSPIRWQAVVLTPGQLEQTTETVVSRPLLVDALGIAPEGSRGGAMTSEPAEAPAFATALEQAVAQQAHQVIAALGSRPDLVPTASDLSRPEVRARIVEEVRERMTPDQLTLEGVGTPVDVAAIVDRTAELVVERTISIPRILVLPMGEVEAGFERFTLDLGSMRYQAPSDDLWAQYLRTGGREILTLGGSGVDEARPEDYVVSGLVDYDDVSYDNHADLLYDLAEQVVRHLESYLSKEDARKVLRCFQKEIARLVHAQMQAHYLEEAVGGYETRISAGYTELKPGAYTKLVRDNVLDYRRGPEDGNITRYVFGGFQRCLYPMEKFANDTERRLAVILERDAVKWFRPRLGQFQIHYRRGGETREYQPDFVAETPDGIYMLEPKAAKDMTNPEVLAKRDAAVEWCRRANNYNLAHGEKGWSYTLIPHSAIAENMTLTGLVGQFGQ